MRLIESIYVGVLLLLVCLCFFSGEHPSELNVVFRLLLEAGLLLAITVLIVHERLEGFHWQMAPAYLAILPLSLALFFPASRAYFALSSFAVLLSAVLCSSLLPMFQILPMRGPHLVGTSLHHLIDTSRKEDLGPSTTGHRELMVQLWYPATPSRHKRAVYRRRQETTRLSSYQAVLRTHSRINAPPADLTPLAILIFHPAWNGRRTQNTFLTEDLASRGFVVAAVDHTYNSEPVAFPDGRVVKAHHERAIEDVASSTPAEVRSIGNAEVLRQAADNSFVLDTLAAWNQQEGSPWFGKLDVTVSGVLGHSLGGAVAVECFRSDPRVRAAMNMDGWTFGTPIDHPNSDFIHNHSLDKAATALLFFQEESRPAYSTPADSASTEADLNAWDYANVRTLLARYGGYHLQLRGANHLNFTDRPASSPVRRLSGGGPIRAQRAHQIIRDITASFFSQALLGIPARWLDDPSARYHEVLQATVSTHATASRPL